MAQIFLLPQGVTWIVMTESIFIGKMQLEEFRASVTTYDDTKVHIC